MFGEKEHLFNYYPQKGVDHSFMNLRSGNLQLQESKKVKLPIVGIHGNHDYPMKTNLQNSAYDMLSITKCVSYIGRVHELSHPVFHPTIFLRDRVALVIYGIGHIKDTSLITILDERRYTIEPVPPEIEKNYKCVKILLFHQNRFKVREPSPGRRKRSFKLHQVQPFAKRIRSGHLGPRARLLHVVDTDGRIGHHGLPARQLDRHFFHRGRGPPQARRSPRGHVGRLIPHGVHPPADRERDGGGRPRLLLLQGGGQPR